MNKLVQNARLPSVPGTLASGKLGKPAYRPEIQLYQRGVTSTCPIAHLAGLIVLVSIAFTMPAADLFQYLEVRSRRENLSMVRHARGQTSSEHDFREVTRLVDGIID